MTSLQDRVIKMTGEMGPAEIQFLLRQIENEQARRDPSVLARVAFKDRKGNPWKVAAFHDEWQRLIPRQGTSQKTLIIAPHEHAKTSEISICRVLWEVGNDPNLRVRILCAEDTMAEAIMSELRQNIESNERLHEIFPALEPGPNWTKTQLTVKRTALLKDPTIQAESVRGGSTGGRCDLLISDDICTYQNTLASPSMIKTVIELFENVWLNLVTEDGRVVVMNTPWAKNDLIGKLRTNPEWVKWEKPAIDLETGKLLWPEHWSYEALRRRRRSMGVRHYQRGFLLIALSQEERTFPDTAIHKKQDLEWGSPIPDDWIRVGGVDPAGTAGNAVFFTAALNPDTRQRIPLELLRMTGAPGNFCKAVIESYKRWHHNAIYIENNNTQASFQDLLQTIALGLRIPVPPLPLIPSFTGSNKWDPSTGLPGMASLMEQGYWPIPWPCYGCGDIPCSCHPRDHDCPSCLWVDELESHPHGTQDILMAQWLAEQGLRKMEFDAVEAGEQETIEVPKASIYDLQF